MNAKIIEFPMQTVRDWEAIERIIIEHCSKNMFPPEVEDRLLGSMKSFWEILDPNLNFSLDISFPSYLRDADMLSIQDQFSSGVSRMSGEVLKSFTTRLFNERLVREIQICYELGLIPA